MIINNSYKINEARTIDLGGGSKAYSYGGKYYIKKGDTKKEICADQYQKLLNKGTDGSDKSSSNTSDNSKNSNSNTNFNKRPSTYRIQDVFDNPDLDSDDYHKREDAVAEVGSTVAKELDKYLKSSLSDEEYNQSIEVLKDDYESTRKILQDLYPSLADDFDDFDVYDYVQDYYKSPKNR